MFIPELVLRNFVQGLLYFYKKDYETRTVKEDSLLYNVIKGQTDGKRDVLQDALNILQRGSSENHSARKLSIHLGYHKKLVNPPSIHITSPGETMVNQGLGPGFGGDNVRLTSENKLNTTMTRDFQAQYAVIVHSDNMMECTIIYQLLKYGLSNLHVLDLGGFKNPVIRGKDMTMDMEIMGISSPVHSKAVLIDAFNTVDIPYLWDKELMEQIVAAGTATSPNINQDGEI